MYKILGITAIALLFWALWWIAQDNLEAMETCQQTRSYDTCAYNILQ